MRAFLTLSLAACLVAPAFADSTEEYQARLKARADADRARIQAERDRKEAEREAERAKEQAEREKNRIKVTEAKPKEGVEVNPVQGAPEGMEGKGVFSYEEYHARLKKKADADRARIAAERAKKEAERLAEQKKKEAERAGSRIKIRQSKADREKEQAGSGLDYLRPLPRD